MRAGNRVYFLTGQWRTVYVDEDSLSPRPPAELLVDLWAFDTTTVAPIYRRRLETVKGGAMLGRSILGAQNQTLWILLPTGVHALNRDTGALSVDPAGIVKANPNLSGLLPVESRFYQFTNAGLSFKAADGRTWHMSPDSLLASETPLSAPAATILPTYFTPLATYSFLERGFDIGSKWLGLLNAVEAATFARDHAIGDLDYQSRRAVYSADITQQQTFFGPRPRYGNFQPLTQEFLAPGMLSEHRSTGRNALLYRRNPDSVFVLHLDRLGQDGRLQLARVTGPAGKILWNAALPLSVLQSVMPDEQSLLLYGRLYRPLDPNAAVRSDPYHSAREMLVSVDWATGAVRSHDHSDTSKHPQAAAATPAEALPK